MSPNAREHAPNIFPFLRYDDAPAALEWIATAFGFERRLVVPGPDGTVAHAEMSLGPGVVMLASAKAEDEPRAGRAGRAPGPAGAGSARVGVYVYVADIDAHFRRARDAGAEIVRELAETDYGSREYSARDPEGHLWSFGTYAPTEGWDAVPPPPV